MNVVALHGRLAYSASRNTHTGRHYFYGFSAKASSAHQSR